MNKNELFRLKERVEEAAKNTSELKGQEKAQLKQLKEDWKCESLEAAEKKIKSLIKQRDLVSEQIETKTEELEEKYNLIEE